MAMVTAGRSGMPPGSDPKKWSARFPVYQIDFTAVASGKRIASSKRRVRWRFGFSNRDALEAGETGTSCRGEEHDVTIVWSVTSGKRLILADGQEVHYSTNRSGVLEYSWTMRGNHVLKVIAHAAPAMSPTPGFRQYDLYVDGQSFFNMPKVYELGLKGPIPSHDRVPGVIDRAERSQASRSPPSRDHGGDGRGGGPRYAGPEAPRNREEEEEDLQRAISASIEESRQHLDRVTGAGKRASKEKVPSPRSQAGGSAVSGVGAASVSVPTSAPMPPAPPIVAPNANLSAGAADLLDFWGDETPITFTTPAPPAGQPGFAVAPPSSAATFASAPSPAPAQPFGAAPAPYGSSSVAGALVPAEPQPASSYYAQQAGFGATAPATDVFGQPSAQYAQAPVGATTDPFASQLSGLTHDPFAPKPPAPPTFNDISSSIMGAYVTSGDAGSTSGSAATPFPPGVAPPPPQPAQLAPPGDSSAFGGSAPPAAPANGAVDAPPAQQFAQLSVNTEQHEETGPKDAFGTAMKNLVNIDDIASPVEMLSLNPFAEDREKEEKEKKKREKARQSRGIPPPGSKFGGAQPSLAEMQTIRSSNPGEKKPIMQSNTYDPNAATAGAMMSHQTQNGNYGPPPISQQGVGFGAGAAMSVGTYGSGASGAYAAPGSYGAPQQVQQQQQMYGAPQMQQQQPQPGYGAPTPQMHYQQQPPPPPQQGYGNYGY